MLCSACGRTLTPEDGFCPGCGTPCAARLAAPFQRTQDDYERLKRQLDDGRLTPDEMSRALNNLMLEHDDAYWSIGGQTGHWYRYDGSAWTEASPPVAAATPTPQQSQPLPARAGRLGRFGLSSVLGLSATALALFSGVLALRQTAGSSTAPAAATAVPASPTTAAALSGGTATTAASAGLTPAPPTAAPSGSAGPAAATVARTSTPSRPAIGGGTAPAPPPPPPPPPPPLGTGSTSATCGGTPAPAGAGASVTYSQGWNLLSGPQGTVVTASAGSLYTFQSDAASYRSQAAGTPLQAGIGYWAYFAAPGTLVLAETGPQAATVNLPASQWIQVGNPGRSVARVSGVDCLYSYEPTTGYAAVTSLAPGRGAWALSQKGAVATIASQ